MVTKRRARVPHKSGLQECPAGECRTRLSYKSVPQECPTRVSTRVPRKIVRQECPTRTPRKSARKSAPPDCATRVRNKAERAFPRVPYKSEPQQCQVARLCHESALRECRARRRRKSSLQEYTARVFPRAPRKSVPQTVSEYLITQCHESSLQEYTARVFLRVPYKSVLPRLCLTRVSHNHRVRYKSIPQVPRKSAARVLY